MSEELKPTMSEEDVKKVLDFVAANQEKEPEDILEQGEERLVNVSIDPVTGKEILTNTEPAEQEEVDFESVLDENDLNLEVDESPISIEELKDYLKDSKDDPMLQGQLSELDMTPEDFDNLVSLVQIHQKHEKITSLYSKMPEACKKIINKSLNIGNNVVYSKEVNSMRNTMAEMFLDQFIDSITVNRASNTVNATIEKVFSQASAEIGDTIVGYTQERNEKYREYINSNIEDPEKKANALKIIDAIDHSYELKKFKEYCKTCKIRKIDVEKPTKDHNNLMDNIMNKYKDEPKFNIYNIYNCQTVLTRHINEGVEAECDQFTDTQIRAFFIAYSMYCKNFSPKNAEEHIFMFYTLYNILLMDVNKGDKAEVSQIFLSNIKECINNLITRNNFLN